MALLQLLVRYRCRVYKYTSTTQQAPRRLPWCARMAEPSDSGLTEHGGRALAVALLQLLVHPLDHHGLVGAGEALLAVQPADGLVGLLVRLHAHDAAALRARAALVRAFADPGRLLHVAIHSSCTGGKGEAGSKRDLWNGLKALCLMGTWPKGLQGLPAAACERLCVCCVLAEASKGRAVSSWCAETAWMHGTGWDGGVPEAACCIPNLEHVNAAALEICTLQPEAVPR